MADWYYLVRGQQVGPVSLEALRSIAAAGQIAPADYVWQQGAPSWAAAGSVPGLFPQYQVPPQTYAAQPAATVPAYTPPPTYAPAPFQPPRPAARAVRFGPIEMRRRILLLVAAGSVFLTFFTPLFLYHGFNNVLGFGWDYWWGIMAFIFAIVAIAAVSVELALQHFLMVRLIFKWAILGLYCLIGLFTLLGLLLGMLAYGAFGIPICIPLMLAAAVLGTVIAAIIAAQEWPVPV